MTTAASLRPRPISIATPWWRRAPKEGWVTVALLLLMLVTIGLAIDNANWAGLSSDGVQQTAFLPMDMVLAGLVGLLLAKTRLPPLLAHFIGACIAGGFLLIATANAISDAPSLIQRLRDVSSSASIFYNDSVVLGIRSGETSVFLLTIVTLVWAVGQFGAFNVFRRGHAMPAIIAGGLTLLINVSITVQVQYPYLITFSAAAMLLLVRMNLATQREGWQRRRIGDTTAASGLFLKGGLIFVVLTLVGSLFLAANASSAPLANAWRNMDDQLLDIGTALNRWIGGVTGAARGPSGLFGSSQTISGIWEASSEVVFDTSSPDHGSYYWRGATYDRFDGYSWEQTDRSEVDVASGQSLLASSADDPSGSSSGALPGTHPVTLTVTSVALAGGTLLAPSTPVTLDRAAKVETNGEGGPFDSIDLQDAVNPGDSYTVTAQVPDKVGDATAVTGADLALAGRQYPYWAKPYIDIIPDSIGPEVAQTADQVVSALPADQHDPYHVAEAIQQYLYSTGGFTYQTDVQGLCGHDKVVDCFLRTKVGYCEHFATTMVMLLRTQQIPARLAMGYLPGHRLSGGSFEVTRAAAHAWVEVYFPTYGWIRFDPTPGNGDNGQQPTTFVPGDDGTNPDASAAPGATPSFGIPPGADNGAIQPGAGKGGPQGNGDQINADPGPLALIVIVLLVLVVGGLALFARRRRLGYAEPDLAYRGMARLATRFGYGPTPTQTAYEYAGTLGEVLPAVRTELQLVARAKVETTYARRRPDGEMRAKLRAAYRRIQIGLLRLVLRRPHLRRRRRS